MQGEQALERHEHKKSYENNLQAKGIHWGSSLGLSRRAVNKRSIGRGVSPITINSSLPYSRRPGLRSHRDLTAATALPQPGPSRLLWDSPATCSVPPPAFSNEIC